MYVTNEKLDSMGTMGKVAIFDVRKRFLGKGSLIPSYQYQSTSPFLNIQASNSDSMVRKLFYEYTEVELD